MQPSMHSVTTESLYTLPEMRVKHILPFMGNTKADSCRLQQATLFVVQETIYTQGGTRGRLLKRQCKTFLLKRYRRLDTLRTVQKQCYI